jgi:hypothetical protein
MGTSRALRVCCLFALAGCPTVDLGEEPPDIGACIPNGGMDYFQNTIWPVVLHPADATKDCAKSGCHQAPGGAGGLGFSTNVPADFVEDYQAAQHELNCTTPTASLLLTKPLAGVDGHGGGDIFTMSDPQYQAFLNWFK